MEKQKKKNIARIKPKEKTVEPEINKQSKYGHYLLVLPDFFEEEDDVYDGKL